MRNYKALPNDAYSTSIEGYCENTCPICNNSKTIEEFYLYDMFTIYCEYCKIIFRPCCLKNRYSSGADFYVQLIVSYTDDNGIVIDSMPLFDSIQDVINSYHDLCPTFRCHNDNCHDIT